MTDGGKISGVDVLGKTVIFAKNVKHADFIQKRFDANYPAYAGQFAQVIVSGRPYTPELIDRFSTPAKLPQIAISVDMLDTGIDVPDIVNLVFFKPVHSKTKYWQMVGRGTRLRPNLYSPGDDKKDFIIFDVCQNIEYFNEDYSSAETPAGEPLGARLFAARLALLAGIDATDDSADHDSLHELRSEIASGLHAQVSGMSLNNFLVRPHRKAVQHFANIKTWQHPTGDEIELANTLRQLPSAADALDTDEQVKRFDLFALRAQLGVLIGDPGFVAAKTLIQAIANALAEQKSIPAIQKELTLIAAVATDEWWDDVTVPMIEMARKHLRGLVNLIDATAKAIVYTDFTGNQLAFVNLVIDQLTRAGVMDPGLLYEAPFTGFAPTGPEALFTPAQVATLVATLKHIRETAVAS